MIQVHMSCCRVTEPEPADFVDYIDLCFVARSVGLNVALEKCFFFIFTDSIFNRSLPIVITSNKL